MWLLSQQETIRTRAVHGIRMQQSVQAQPSPAGVPRIYMPERDWHLRCTWNTHAGKRSGLSPAQKVYLAYTSRKAICTRVVPGIHTQESDLYPRGTTMFLLVQPVKRLYLVPHGHYITIMSHPSGGTNPFSWPMRKSIIVRVLAMTPCAKILSLSLSLPSLLLSLSLSLSPSLSIYICIYR